MRTSRIVTLLSAVSAASSDGYASIKYAEKVTLEFTENATVLNRSGVLTVLGSIDGGTNYRAFAMLVSNAAHDNTKTKELVASVTRSTLGTTLVALDLEEFGFTDIKVNVAVTDGSTPTGTFTVKAYIESEE